MVKSNLPIADVFTKGLSFGQFEKLRELSGVQELT